MLRDLATGTTVLNRETERLFIEMGGTNPNKPMSAEQLAQAAASSIDALADGGNLGVLERVYTIARNIDPQMPSLETLKLQALEEARSLAAQSKKSALTRVK